MRLTITTNVDVHLAPLVLSRALTFLDDLDDINF